MLCYFIAKKDFKILNCVEVAGYSVAHDLDCGGKTNITIAGDPGASDEDFVILKDRNKVKFRGIVEKIDNADGEIKYNVSCFEIERCFDRKIILSDVNLIASTGIEDFIANAIEKHFANTGDPFSDMPYIRCEVLTHTKVSAKPAADDGIYNLKTYIGNIKQQYGIYLDFDFTKDGLHISIYKKEQSAMQIDTTITDIYTCKETYKIKVLSKLIVKWLNTTTQAESMRYFYLHSDRSVSEVNTDRVDGTISTVYIEAETEAEMIQEAKNEFKSNSYSHSIEAEIAANSKLYPASELYVGHEVTIKTAAAGIQKSIISKIAFSDAADIITIKFGILKVSLTEKIK